MAMGEQMESRTFVIMMVDSLKKKKKVLVQLLSLTKKQEDLYQNDKLKTDSFDYLFEKKEEAIDQLNTLDEGFEQLFRRIKPEIEKNRLLYEEEIRTMQKLIAEISELSVKIQTIERQNSERFKKFLAKEREIIKNYYVNSKIATAYHQNMNNVQRTKESYFFNEKK